MINTVAIYCVKDITYWLLIAIGYFFLAQVGQLFAISPGNVTPVWPPSGFILAILLVFGKRLWPGVFLGAFMGNIYAYFSVSSLEASLLSITSGLFNGTGDALCALVGAYKMQQNFSYEKLFSKAKNIVIFVCYAGLLGSLISCVFGTLGLYLCGFIRGSQILTVSSTWFVGDLIGILLISPLILTFSQWQNWEWFCLRKGAELIFYMFLLIVTLSTSFGILNAPFIIPETIILPVLIFSIVRYPKHISIATIFSVCILSIIVTAVGNGPFKSSNMNDSLVQLELFLFTICLTSYVLLSYITEQNETYTNLTATKAKLKYLAEHDELTGLTNRNLFKSLVNNALSRNKSRKVASALMFIDLDNFKTINDSLGHTMGDTVLGEVSTRFTNVIRQEELLCRHGGDEFIVFISCFNDYNQLNNITRRLLTTLENPIILKNSLPIYVSASIGIAIAPDNGNSYDLLIQNADVAMYKAKDLGRNQYCYFDLTQNSKASRLFLLSTHLRQARENSEMYVVYQPLYSAITHQIVGAEALIRWHHPELGEISPFEFIPVAEQNNCIDSIFKFVLEESLKSIKKWLQYTGENFYISINVSPKQFDNNDLDKFIEKTLKKYQVSTAQITIEITESSMFKNEGQSKKILRNLSKLGIKIALDDFGTGYSSLSVIRNFPINTIKIDKSFLYDLYSEKQSNLAFIKSIILMAKELNMSVIGEGIEEKETLEIFESEGGDIIQGYYFSKPLNEADFDKLLLQTK